MKDIKKADKKQESPRQPLFTGNGVRDASVSEMEKLADASFTIRQAIERLARKDQNK